MEMTDVREDLAAFRREVSALREVVSALREEMFALRGVVAPLREKVTILNEVVAKDNKETKKLKGEYAALHDAMVRLEQAIIEERTTRQTVVEDLRQEVRRRAAPSGRPQGKITKAFHDVTAQTEPQPSAHSDVIVQTEPQPSADSDTTVLREALRTVTTFDAPSAIGEDQLTALLQSLPHLEELTVRVPSFGTGRWLRLLPTSLRTLYVAGPEMTEPRWPGWYGNGLSVSLQGVAADTISHLATELGSRITLLVTDAQVTTIPSQLRDAIIRVGPNTIILPAGVGDSELTELRSSRETVERLSVSTADLPRLRGQLPEGLKRLNVRGPEVTEPSWPGWDEDDDLSVSLQGVAADTISHLADLRRTVRVLEIYDCPDLTAGSLEPLTRCPGLWWLTLSGGVHDAVLDSLSGCPGLKVLTLGNRQRPAETAFTAAAYTRLVKSCRKLQELWLHCTADTGQAVLTALKEADLGRDSDGRPRIINLIVPEELWRQLERQEGGRVTVYPW
ncbi:uncharacterized protein LOC122379282 isoform X2 [Amphibalanus amphitrite]|uniref:uncharacterized protein LOC122379282 isoform X2 n=1 Tax=Amphibalanus amphitrite TaxID=1232801 RepID=UPI001C91A988|nr:uncharacterized protein LOC122379282 isoform X2 [Amphibalanus amphitrite]